MKLKVKHNILIFMYKIIIQYINILLIKIFMCIFFLKKKKKFMFFFFLKKKKKEVEK